VRNPDPSDTNAFNAMVPGKSSAWSARVVFVSSVSEETARKIVLTLGPVPE